MIAHGVKHGRSLPDTAGWFRSIGFRQSRLQAQASAVAEIGSGALLVAGAATPLAAAAVIGTMGVAARPVHAANGSDAPDATEHLFTTTWRTVL
jgi:putative oxidoreductase